MTVLRAIGTRLAGAGKNARRTIVVAALATLVVAGAAAPASADIWGMSDNFENNPASRWTPHASGVGGGHFSNNSNWAHSGSGYAYRWVETGYSSVRRNVNITPAQFHDPNCAARIYVRAVNTTALVDFEIINPSGWTLISHKAVALVPSQGWTQILTPSWHPNRVDVVVRVRVIGTGAVSDIRIDDLSMTCQFF